MKKVQPSTRRTRADIALMSISDVTAGLVDAGIRPIEFVLVKDSDPYYRNKLEPWQRYDFAEYMHRASDPFILDFFTRFPPDDLRTIWRTQLYNHELQTYVSSLTRAQLMTQLKVVSVDDHFDRKPEPNWNAEQCRTELSSRITELEKQTTKLRRKPR